MVGTPAYEAGLDRGDALLSIDGTPVNDADAVQAVIQARQPGDTVAIEFEHRGVTRAPRLALVPEPRLELVPLDSVDGRLTAEAQRFREEWLGSKVR
jgi:predicted metalloprotease with PDZ domain